MIAHLYDKEMMRGVTRVQKHVRKDWRVAETLFNVECSRRQSNLEEFDPIKVE